MKNIKDLLNTREISLLKLSTQIGVSRQTIESIVNDYRKPSFLTIKKICNFFKVDYHEYI